MIGKESEMKDIITYLEGRAVYLRTVVTRYEPGCSKEGNAQARLFEVIEALNVVKELAKKGKEKDHEEKESC